MIDVEELLATLAEKRPIFHSEADFQHALAWEIHQRLPSASIRLERPVQVDGSLVHLDIWYTHDDQCMAAELKYKTRALVFEFDSESFSLKDQSAQDTGRYDFIKDISRLEQVIALDGTVVGYAIFLTNDSAYWTVRANRRTVDADFRLYQGRILEGTLRWGAEASAGTTKDREAPLFLRGIYPIHWQTYSQPSATRYGEFRYLVIRVTSSFETFLRPKSLSENSNARETK